MLPGRHTKHMIQLLQRQRLCFRQAKVRKRPSKHVPRGVPPERALRLERRLQRRPRQRDDEVEEPRRGCGKGHADVADVQRESLRRVCEWHRPFAGGVHDHEEVDACGDAAEAGVVVDDVEGEAGEEEEDCHERKGGEEQVAAAKGVDCVDGGEGEDPVDDAAAEGREEGLLGGELCGLEHGGGVVHDCVDAAELFLLAVVVYIVEREHTCCMNMTKKDD